MTNSYYNNIAVDGEINLIGKGKNGTIFDFKNTKKGGFNVSFNNENGSKLTFQNIIFQDFTNAGDENISLIQIDETNLNQKIYFQNCIFKNIKSVIIKLFRDNECPPNLDIEKFLSINIENCDFYDNHEKLIFSYVKYNTKFMKYSICQNITIKNSTFINNGNLVTLQSGILLMENCKINGIISEQSSNSFFSKLIETYGINNSITLKDCEIINGDIQDYYPYFYITKGTLLIENCKFSNLFTRFYYLFQIEDTNSIFIKNSYFEKTSNLFYILNTGVTLKNIVMSNYSVIESLPLLDSGTLSNVTISDSKFNNIAIQGNSLFGEETLYFLSNVTMNDISINSNALINFNYNKKLEFNNIEIFNVLCVGDNSSLLNINTNDHDNAFINLRELKIHSCKSNGALIKLNGKKNIISISNSEIYNNTCYGSVIENISKESNINIENLKVYKNSNINRYNCGILRFSNCQHSIQISNSSFYENKVYKNGGALCFDELLSSSINITNNLFSNNDADMNGGAIYISYQEIFNNSKINILNNTFFNNHSKYFGGALYLDKIYDIFLNDSIFENNLAEISGSSLYSPNEAISKSNLYYINHKNNTTNMNESIYSTFPSNIILDNFDSFNYLNESKFHIGDYINLKFSLRDKYGNKIIEFLKYNNISLKVVVISNDKIKIKGNVCTFTQNTGICQLQYFQIFSESKVKLTLKFEIENNIYNIKSIDNLNITIYDCEENQIKILDGKHYKCEYPVCESWCMNNNKTKCVPSSTIINVNKLELNVCECRPGYIGYHCEDLLFENFNNIKIAINIITSLIIFIMIISLILILIKRNQPILSDTGWIKQLIILIGLIQYFSSKYFIINENWTQSYLSFLFKHSGIFLTYLIFWIYVSSAQDFGVGNRDYELKIAIKKSRSRSLFTPSYIMEGEKLISDDKSKELSFIRSELKTQKIYEKVRKNHFLYIKCLFYFPIIIFILISCVIYQNKARKIKGDSFYYVQGQNEKWYYESPLKSNDIVFNIIEFIISIILALKLKKISKYECIFKTIKYIYIVVIIIITIGPLIDVIGFYVLKNIIYQVLFNYITNLICYTSVYGFFFGKLILYLLLKKEKCCNIEAYFVYPTKSFCYEHWSYLCECEKSLTPLEINFKMKRFIEVYIQCSKIIEIYDGNIKLLNSSFGLNLNQDF